MFRLMGDESRVTVDGVTFAFKGMFETVQTPDVDEFGREYLRKEDTLLVREDIAKKLDGRRNVPLTHAGKKYFCNEVVFEDDGRIARLFLHRDTDNGEAC